MEREYVHMKIKYTVKILSAAVAILIFLTGCAPSGAGNEPDLTQTINNESISEETTTAPAEENIFAGLESVKYDGREFNILSRDTELNEFSAEEETGDIINDSIYKRNKLVEETFDVTINVKSYVWDENIIKNSVTAGDGAYDLVDNYAAFAGNLIGAGVYLNLLDVPHLRLTESWWSQHAVNELTVNGRLYIVPGDITINLWETIMTVFFSKGWLEASNLESPYNLVKNGEWTLEKMLELCRSVSADVNGDGIMYTEDRYRKFGVKPLDLSMGI
jgi:ABC-type glycerol-3-phosphate transport system substrate-binding protein